MDETAGRAFRRHEASLQLVTSSEWLKHSDADVRASYLDDLIRVVESGGEAKPLFPCDYVCKAYHSQWGASPAREPSRRALEQLVALAPGHGSALEVLVRSQLVEPVSFGEDLSVIYAEERWRLTSGQRSLALTDDVVFRIYTHPTERCLLTNPDATVVAGRVEGGWLVGRSGAAPSSIPFAVEAVNGKTCKLVGTELTVREPLLLTALAGVPVIDDAHRDLTEVLVSRPLEALSEHLVVFDVHVHVWNGQAWEIRMERREFVVDDASLLRPRDAAGCERSSTLGGDASWSCPSAADLDDLEGVFQWYR